MNSSLYAPEILLHIYMYLRAFNHTHYNCSVYRTYSHDPSINLLVVFRSEMHEITVTVRYGLLLEAYLKSSQEHLAILSKQQDALVKLNAFSEIAKNGNVSP